MYIQNQSYTDEYTNGMKEELTRIEEKVKEDKMYSMLINNKPGRKRKRKWKKPHYENVIEEEKEQPCESNTPQM